MRRITVLGMGNFGTALACNWLAAGHRVVGWTVEGVVYESIIENGINEKYLPGVRLDGLAATMDLEAAVSNAEIVVFALPSSVVLDVFAQALPALKKGQVILDLAKGLAPDDRLISEVMAAQLASVGKANPLCVMMGPTIAPELAHGVYTNALVASLDHRLAQRVASELSTKTLTLSPANDPMGAEYWGAFKNIIALACGVVDGLKADGRGGDNLKAAVFTAGYREAVRLLPELGAAMDTAFSPAGIGDLFVTATSPHGRNREMGERLGRGQSLAEAEAAMVMVSEGVRAARMFAALFAARSIDAPFVNAVCGLLQGEADMDFFLKQLMALD
ncbi:MAG: NAD(P)H-dependent glycerol-3-phosphate dehydrogenase [Gammaproteobacteria bacterium]|jgi:glycerol-3-phosphate dehydrogenase (NAD(P)+)|nr:NAD(P)H-dependent glycerol-3-phosphate dehydrogenase [Gammaproteobacteria bacterium]